MKVWLMLLAAMVPSLSSAGDRSGEEIYNCTCIVCHGDGRYGAPKFGDMRRWTKLIKEGRDDIIPAALAGVRHMPPKGGNPNLSATEVARAAVFMANRAGAGWEEPTPAQIEQWQRLAAKKTRH